MSKSKNLKWLKETIDLDPNHNWKATDGYNLFVVGRGAVHMEVPRQWKLEAKAESFSFTDREPPDDDCRLEVSYRNLPPSHDWDTFPLKRTLRQVMENDDRQVTEWGPISLEKRKKYRLVWTEIQFIDSETEAEPRAAFSRTAIALGCNIQCLITFDCWENQREKFISVWDHAIETLIIGKFINDPRTGFERPD